MNGLILEGGTGEKTTYLENFIKDRQIPAYNINRYQESVKIAEVRALIKHIAVSAAAPRLFIFESELREDSQNAMLKTLEELPDDVFIIFAGGGLLLPTIYSRCTVVSLIHDSGGNTQGFGSLAMSLEKGDFAECLIALDRLLESESLESFILGLRGEVLKNIGLQKPYHNSAVFLAKFNEKFPTLKNNNLNIRLFTEKALIDTLEGKNGVN